MKTGGSIFETPENSPWGEVDWCETLCPGVFLVSAPGHGGVMVSGQMTDILSPAARKQGLKKGGYLCFEEDTEEAIVLRELLDKKLWVIPDRIKDKAAFEDDINSSLKKYHPAYWRSRENGITRMKALAEKKTTDQRDGR